MPGEQGLPAVGPDRPEPVRLVVDDRVPLGIAQAQHGVDAAGEVAAQRLGLKRCEPVRVGGERIAGWQVAAQQRDEVAEPDVRAGGVAARERQLEVELREPVRGREIGEAAVGGERAERGAGDGDERVRQRVGIDGRSGVAVQLGADAAQQLGSQVRCGEVGRLEHGVHQRAEPGADGQVRHGGGDGERRVAAAVPGTAVGRPGAAASVAVRPAPAATDPSAPSSGPSSASGAGPSSSFSRTSGSVTTPA